jgi:mono/diheme cytochrome c family protein
MPALTLPLLAACLPPPPTDWGAYDILAQAPPEPPRTMGGVALTEAEHRQVAAWGEGWFRNGEFGTERAITDLAGIWLGKVEVPCGAGCWEEKPVLPYVVAAIDALDGTLGNAFSGNGGAYTHDLVLRFPAGARLYGGVPVPQEVHTGLDVDAGASWPIGLPAVPAPESDASLPWLPEPASLGGGPATAGRVRFRLTCALCHYSLDIDNDGHTDLRSSRIGESTPGATWGPEDAWGVGNNDLAIGWIVALAANPLLLSAVFSGPIGDPAPDAPMRWMTWVRDHYRDEKQAVLREVVIGMLLQPRGFADVTPDARFDTNQFPNLYTWHTWPSNSDGAVPDATDRNNIVWTGTLDFSGLIGTCSDRAGGVTLPWDRPVVFELLPCDTLVDMMTRYSPYGMALPEKLDAFKADILGTADGVPGLVDPDNALVVLGSPTLPRAIYDHQANVKGGRQRTPADFGPTGKWRGPQTALLGYRLRTPRSVREALNLEAFAAGHPGLNVDDFINQAVNVWLDTVRPPENATPLLSHARDLVPAGRKVFEEVGCVSCHRGPFGTDNQIHRLAGSDRTTWGLPRAPSTAGWRVADRADGAPIETDPQRAWDSRNLRRLVSPPYDPRTGDPAAAGGPLQGFFRVQSFGFRTSPLHNLWASAPYLHEGGVAVGLSPSAPVAGSDLRALLKRAGGADLLYGMGSILAQWAASPGDGPATNAALSLQALVLEEERRRVVEGNRVPVIPVSPGSTWRQDGGSPPRELVSMVELGAPGTGHDFWLADAPGGDRVTALVAYLLALDDCPRQLPGDPPSKACGTTIY